MRTNGTNLRRFRTNNNVSAVPALPNLNFALLKYLLHLYIIQKRAIPLLVVLLNSAHCPELSRKLRESFRFRSLGEILIHLCPFVILAFSRRKQIVRRSPNTVQLLEPNLRVLLLIIS